MAANDSIHRSHNFKDLTGKLFGRLTVLTLASITNGNSRWLCQCECGTTKAFRATHLTSGTSQSCGCFQREQSRERATTHGRTKTPEFNSWVHILGRCYNTANPDYENYGGRGINVCDRWRTSFEAFLEDMGPRPSPKHSIDRYPNNDGNYEPGNCRWATRREQNRNTRQNVLLTFRGKTQCLTDWAEELSVNVGTLWARLRLGWSVERALTAPILRRGQVVS